LPLKTKYYTADISFHIYGADAVSEAKKDESKSACQGLVLVYDANSRQSFEALKAWGGFAKRITGANVMLLVANASATEIKESKTCLDLEQTALSWALDNHMEVRPRPLLPEANLLGSCLHS
jgi:hypothetical protein